MLKVACSLEDKLELLDELESYIDADLDEDDDLDRLEDDDNEDNDCENLPWGCGILEGSLEDANELDRQLDDKIEEALGDILGYVDVTEQVMARKIHHFTTCRELGGEEEEPEP